jgi:hypothetical protein
MTGVRGIVLSGLLAIIASQGSAAELTRCNGFNDGKVAWAAVAAGADKPIALRSLTPEVLLPDGTPFKTWEQPADHRRTFYVARQHPQASDDNPGSEDRPWKTIGRAAAALEPGDRVIVREGIYREWVRPARGGTSPQNMITYQAASGQNVIVSGADPLTGNWAPSQVAGRSAVGKAWMIDLPASLFAGYNPFAESNVSATMSKSPYNRDGGKKWSMPPYTLPRGLVFQDGQRLAQAEQYEGLAEADGSYWVEAGGRRLHIRAFGDKKPESVSFEVTTRPFAIAPDKAGLGFVRVDGFVVERVANCVPVPQLGAISTMQGHHWIVENNAVRQINGLGLDYGRRQTFIPYEVPADTPKLAGVGTIVRRNVFDQCGACSLSGLGLIGGLVEDNYSSGCGWRRVKLMYESGGIKLHYLKHTLVRRNVVQGTNSTFGLYVDHSNHNSRITANLVTGAEDIAFILEATYSPTLVDHNIFWNCKGAGMRLTHTGSAIIANNLIGCCTGLPVSIAKPDARIIDVETQRKSSAEHNRVVGNVFYGFETRGPELPQNGENVSDFNVFVNPADAKPFDMAAWRAKTGCETHSQTATAVLELSTADWRLRGTIPTLESPLVPALTTDFLGIARHGTTSDAGPFLHQSLKAEITLFTGNASPAKPSTRFPK